MKRIVLFAVFLLAAVTVLFAGWSPKWGEDGPVPTKGLYSPGFGRCVALSEGDQLIGMTFTRTEDMEKQKKNLSGFAISTYNAVALIAQQAGRPDLASLAVDLELRSGKIGDIALEQTPNPGGPGIMVCVCENSIWAKGRVIGCGGACGSCSHCYVLKPAIR